MNRKDRFNLALNDSIVSRRSRAARMSFHW